MEPEAVLGVAAAAAAGAPPPLYVPVDAVDGLLCVPSSHLAWPSYLLCLLASAQLTPRVKADETALL